MKIKHHISIGSKDIITGLSQELQRVEQENLKLRSFLHGFTEFVKENDLTNRFDAWIKEKINPIEKGGDDNGLQNERKEGRKDADEAGEDCGTCCKEGEEEVGGK